MLSRWSGVVSVMALVPVTSTVSCASIVRSPTVARTLIGKVPARRRSAAWRRRDSGRIAARLDHGAGRLGLSGEGRVHLPALGSDGGDREGQVLGALVPQGEVEGEGRAGGAAQRWEVAAQGHVARRGGAHLELSGSTARVPPAVAVTVTVTSHRLRWRGPGDRGARWPCRRHRPGCRSRRTRRLAGSRSNQSGRRTRRAPPAGWPWP